MSRRRDIYDENPDEVRQFDDLVSGYDTRDDAGLPLGDVYGHALNRLKISYGILEAAKLAADIWGYGNGDGVPPIFEAYPVGAHPQDRTGWSRQYPAAHVSPCRLEVGDPQGAPTRTNLYRRYGCGITRGFVEGLFSRTDIIHKLANYSDGLCEGTSRTAARTGMSHVLASSCTTLFRDQRASARTIFFDELIPGYGAVAAQQLDAVETGLIDRFADALEPEVGLVDPTGRPFSWNPEGRTDTRVHSPSPLAWKANRRAVVQILEIYASTLAPRSGDLAEIRGQFVALRANEQREARNGNNYG